MKEDDSLSNKCYEKYGGSANKTIKHSEQFQLFIDFLDCINLPKQERKKSQHYVFQAYMKAWGDQALSKKDSKKVIVWACRGDYCYPVATDKIGFINGFYSIPRLTEEEKTVIRIYWKSVFKYPESTIRALEKHLASEQYFYRLLDTLDKVKAISEKIGLKDDEKAEIDKWISEKKAIVEVYNNNSMENFLGGVEADLMPYINQLKNLDASFYYQPQLTEDGINSKHDFLNFVSIQYFRTKYLRDQVEDNYKQLALLLAKSAGLDVDQINPDHIIPVTFWAFQALLGSNLYSMNAHLTIWKNESNVPYITGGQPVINLAADYSDKTKQPTECIFYYPLSPTVAITINDNNEENVMAASKEQVDEFNRTIAAVPTQLIIGNSKDAVERYKQYLL